MLPLEVLPQQLLAWLLLRLLLLLLHSRRLRQPWALP
jgi:hypothetical protein